MLRWRHFPSCLLLGLGLGCVPQSSIPIAPNPPPGVAREVTPEKDLPKRQPQAATCVALGNMQFEAATAEAVTPMQQRTPAQKRDMLDLARKYYQQALKIDPNCLDAHYALARAYEESGEYDRAVETYHQALKNHPKENGFYFELGMCQARHKDWKPALKNIETATLQDPENRAYSTTMAYTLARAGYYDDSVAYFAKTVGEAQAHYNVARMLHHVQQEAACKEQLRLALLADPNMKEAQRLLTELNGPASGTSRNILTASFESQVEPGTGTGNPNR